LPCGLLQRVPGVNDGQFDEARLGRRRWRAPHERGQSCMREQGRSRADEDARTTTRFCLQRRLRCLGKPGQQGRAPRIRLRRKAHAGRASPRDRPGDRRGVDRRGRRKRARIDRQVDPRKRRSLPLPLPVTQINRPDSAASAGSQTLPASPRFVRHFAVAGKSGLRRSCENFMNERPGLPLHSRAAYANEHM